MIDWTAFHTATVAGTRPALLANACARVWRWLDMPVETRASAVMTAQATDADARTTIEALTLVWCRLWREAGVDPHDAGALQRALDDLAAARASDRVIAAAHRTEAAIAIRGIVLDRFPPPPPAPTEDLARLNAATPALGVAIEGVGIGLATPASLAALDTALDQFAPLGPDLAPAVGREHAWWMATAWWAKGAGLVEVLRHDEARAAFEESARWYQAAGDEAAVAACRQRIETLSARVRADVDTVAAADARTLLSALAPLDRVEVLAHQSLEVGRAGDRFEAAALAELAAALLVSLGYPDPEAGFDAALQQWLTTATAARTGTDLFAHLCAVVGHWAAIAGARANERLARDADGSARAERLVRGLAGVAGDLAREADVATQEAVDRLAVWDLDAAQLAPNRRVDRSTGALAGRGALDDALHALRVACNEGPSAALLAQADDLLGRAEVLGSRVHAARALIERTYILLALERFAEVAPSAIDARRRLLAGHPARLDSFSTTYERELYLTTVTFEARAAAANRDHAAILALCVPVLRELETERHQVSSPYQQSASLATRTEVYELVVAAAYRAGDPDLVLDTSERLKARAALASLRRRDPGADGTEAHRQWQAVIAALRIATPGTADAAVLRERRRWLSTLVAIERAREARVPETLTVDAVTNALAPDEGAVSWFWVRADALVVQAFTREAHDIGIVILDDTQQALWREYLACVTTLSGGVPADSPLPARVGELLAALGPVLFPPRTREIVAGCRHLVLSTHRALHLFPFHAIPWPAGDAGGFLIERHAVRYVPNLTSLLVPWDGTREGRVLAVGVTWFDRAAIPPLPGAEAEARAVATAHGSSGHLLRGPDRATFLAKVAAERYRCVHLATHGSSVLTGEAVDDPLESCFWLCDGDLTAWDLTTLDLRAELVVLAACSSGQRAVAGRGLASLPGDDLFGLQAVLFEAGAWGVLGALWPVDDETTREIMTRLHRAYADRQPAARALQSAIAGYLAMPGARRDAFFWAPFVLSTLGVNDRMEPGTFGQA